MQALLKPAGTARDACTHCMQALLGCARGRSRGEEDKGAGQERREEDVVWLAAVGTRERGEGLGGPP